VKRHLTPAKLAGAVAGLVLLTLGALYLIPSDDYILLPDRAHAVAPLVRVEGGHDPRGRGTIFFVDVFERRASELESLFPWLHRGATLVPAHLLVPPGTSDKAAHEADLRAMEISQRIAAAVALRHLGYHVTAKPSGVVVDDVESSSHAVGVVHPADVIVAVNGKPTPTVGKLRRLLARVEPGETVTLSLRRGSNAETVRVQTVASPVEKGRAIIGITPDQAADIRLPLNVEIDAGNVGGPSAGLAFTLEVMAELGHDPTNGYRVAATGQIELDGTVAPIGGVKQKTYGVKEAGAEVFLVPAAGGNAATAKRYAGSLRVIAVHSFGQALRALAKLPSKG
jgi:PDZ domain-containing protein